MDSSVPTVQPTQQKQEDIGIARKTLDFLFGTESIARIAKGEASSNDYGMLAFQMATMFVPPAKFLKLGKLLGPMALHGVQEASLKTIAREGTSTAAREAAQANHDAAGKALAIMQKKKPELFPTNIEDAKTLTRKNLLAEWNVATPERQVEIEKIIKKKYPPTELPVDESAKIPVRESDAKEYDPVGDQLNIRREIINEFVSVRKRLENPKLSDEQFKILSASEKELRAAIKQSNKLINRDLPALHLTRLSDTEVQLIKDKDELVQTKASLEEKLLEYKSATKQWEKDKLKESISIQRKSISRLEHNIEVARIEIAPGKNIDFKNVHEFTPSILNGEKVAYEEGKIAQRKFQRSSIKELNTLAAQYAKLKEIKDAATLPLIERAKLGIREFTPADKRELRRLKKALNRESYGNLMLQILEEEIPIRSPKVSKLGEPNLENVVNKRKEMLRRSEEIVTDDGSIIPMRAGGREMLSLEGVQESVPHLLNKTSLAHDNVNELFQEARYKYIHPALYKSFGKISNPNKEALNELYGELDFLEKNINDIVSPGGFEAYEGQYSQLVKHYYDVEYEIYNLTELIARPVAKHMPNPSAEKVAARVQKQRRKWAFLFHDQNVISKKVLNHATGSPERLRLDNELKVISQKMKRLSKVMSEEDIKLASSESWQTRVAGLRKRTDTDTVTTLTKDALREEWKTATPERKAEIEKFVGEKFKTPGRVKKTGPLGVDKPNLSKSAIDESATKEVKFSARSLSDIVVHSGGAEGADTAWAKAADKVGIKTTAHSFEGHESIRSAGFVGERPKLEVRNNLTQKEMEDQTKLVNAAGKKLGKRAGTVSDNGKLVHRNSYQVKDSDAVLAVVNGWQKIADGSRFTIGGQGTPWAVEMGITLGKPVFAFEQGAGKWFKFNYKTKIWDKLDGLPPNFANFAGVGTRELKANGKKAIEEYMNKLSASVKGK